MKKKGKRKENETRKVDVCVPRGGGAGEGGYTHIYMYSHCATHREGIMDEREEKFTSMGLSSKAKSMASCALQNIFYFILKACIKYELVSPSFQEKKRGQYGAREGKR